MSDSVLKFNGYTVERLCFVKHNIAVSNEPISIQHHISKRTSKEKDGIFTSTLKFETVPTENVVYPFDIEVVLTGYFQLGADITDQNVINAIIEQNSFAILFPFLRSVIASLTATANIPPIILPIINLSQTKEG